jgi:hypothetical protein
LKAPPVSTPDDFITLEMPWRELRMMQKQAWRRAICSLDGTFAAQNSLCVSALHFGATIFGEIDMGFEYSGILGIIILILDIWAIMQIIKGGGSTATKVVWILVILLLPVIGLLIWLLAGRNRL